MKFKNSSLSRNVSLFKIAGKVIASEIKDRVIQMDSVQQIQEKVKLAKMMTTELGSLKGAAMKMGQMMSLDVSDFLPPEAVEIIGKLQKDAEPVDFEIIETQLKAALKERYSDLTIEKKPLAVASIGQVHRGSLDGKDLVFKVQYPGIKKTIETDIRLLKILMGQTTFLMGKSFPLDDLFQELRTILIQETDYQREAEKLRKAQVFFARDDRYVFPHSYAEYSNASVLVMDYMQGITLTEWLKQNPSRAEMEKIGQALYELFLDEFFKLGMVQTDPNPGNFLINSRGQIVVLDFGAAKEYDQEFKDQYLQVLKAAYSGDTQAVLDHSVTFKLISPKEDENVRRYYGEMIDFMISPFRLDQDFHFNDHEFFKKSTEYAINISKMSRHSAPPQHLIFLHRKLGGIFQLLKKMEIRMNVYHYWKKYIEQN